MKSMNRWFRKHKKKLLAYLVVILMVAWGVGGAVSTLIPPRPYGEIAGETITMDEMRERVERWRAVVYPRADVRSLRGTVWEHLAFIKAAERMGLDVTEPEVRQALAPGGRFGWLGRQLPRGVPEKARLKTFRELMLATKAREYLADSVHVTTAEAWCSYARQNEKVKVRYVEVPAAAFRPLVKPTKKELVAFYEKHKDEPVSRDGGSVGYKQPSKVKIEYLIARYDDFKKGVSITEKQIADHYEKHKDSDYRLPDPEPEKKPEADKATEADKSPAKEPDQGAAKDKPAADADKPAEAKPTQNTAEKGNADTKPQAKPDAKAAEREDKAPEPRYKPLAEVREEIVKALTHEAAQAKAIEAINAVDLKIGEQMRFDRALPFAGLAKKGSLVHKKTEFFAEHEAEDTLVGAYELARTAFDASTPLNYPSKPMDCVDGKFIFQVLAKRDPTPDPYETVEAKVREDYVVAKALDKVTAFAVDGVDIMKKHGFEKGVEELRAKLKKLLPPGKPSTAPQESKPPATAAKSEANKGEVKEASKAPAKPEPLIRSGETDFFGGPITTAGMSYCYISGLAGDRPKVGEKAFRLKPSEYGVATEDADERAAYIIQVTGRQSADPKQFGSEKSSVMRRLQEEKRRRLMKQWEDDVKRTAKLVGAR